MNRILTAFFAGTAFGLGATAVPLLAAVNLPNTFSAGETASASEVNGNFQALATAVEDLQANVQDLGTRVSSLEGDVSGLKGDVSTLEDAAVQRLNPYLEVYDTASDVPGGAETTDARAPIVRVTGANLQIVNGAGVDSQQRPSANGLGNLLVGYARSRGHFTGSPETCSNGEFFDNEGNCTGNGHTWSLNHHSGSHNVVAGIGAAYSATGGLIAGEANVINRDATTVSGGSKNIAAGERSIVSGGNDNIAAGQRSIVSGGNDNIAAGERSSVSGGSGNEARAPASVISAGQNNTTRTNGWAAVSGGYGNTAEGEYSVVSGGDNNTTEAQSSVVSGGSDNTAASILSVVSGGLNHETTQQYEYIAPSP